MKNILESLTNEEKRNLKIVHLYKDEIIYLEGETCENVGLVFLGKVKIASFLEDGREIIYNTIEKGMMFGNNLIFSSNPKYRGDVIAVEDSYIYAISKTQLIEILKTNEDFLLAYLNAQSDFGKDLNLKIKLLTLNNANERIMYYLQMNNNMIEYKTITDLAKTLYLTREVLSRTLHKMERQNLLTVRDHKIVKI